MMPRATRKTNIRVEVEPRQNGDFGFAIMRSLPETEEQMIGRCEAIAEQIRRHVDDLPSRGARGVSVIWDTEAYCEYCGSPWTEGRDSPHNGGCCDEDVALMDAAEAQ